MTGIMASRVDFVLDIPKIIERIVFQAGLATLLCMTNKPIAYSAYRVILHFLPSTLNTSSLSKTDQKMIHSSIEINAPPSRVREVVSNSALASLFLPSVLMPLSPSPPLVPKSANRAHQLLTFDAYPTWHNDFITSIALRRKRDQRDDEINVDGAGKAPESKFAKKGDEVYGVMGGVRFNAVVLVRDFY